jgi:hypothetical protein
MPGLVSRLVARPFFPFLFAAHPVAALLLNNVSKVPLVDALGPLLVLEGFTLLVLINLRLICHQWRRAAMYSFLIILLMLYFQRFDDALTTVTGPLNVWLSAALWSMVFVAGWLLVRRHEGNFSVATKALNAAAILFLIVPVGGVAWHVWQVTKVRAAGVEAMNRPVPVLTASANGQLPDIWYIVLDRYARGDVLKSDYGFDNSEFLSALTGQGFQVLEKSAANYQRTAHSLASSLNLDYLDAVTDVVGKRSPDWVLLYQLLQDFRVWRALKPLGYEYSHFGSWWTPTAENPHADRNFVYRVTPTFQRFLIGHSLPGRLAKTAGWQQLDERRKQCDRVEFKFDQLNKLAAGQDRPAFIFAHFLMPHPPFVVNEDGSCLSEKAARSRSRAENYLGQVRYTNRQLLALVQAIRARKDRPAIIILQADEGPWPARIAGDEHTVGMDTTPVHWQNLRAADLLEKQAIFHAISLPDASVPLAADMSPVNTFRLIFRHWFGADLPPLPDESYIYLDNGRVFGFQRITEKLR